MCALQIFIIIIIIIIICKSGIRLGLETLFITFNFIGHFGTIVEYPATQSHSRSQEAGCEQQVAQQYSTQSRSSVT